MNNALLHSLLTAAQTHVKRLHYALDQLQGHFPTTAAQISTLGEQECLLWELLTNRFAKLQDLMGNKLFTVFLEEMGENTATWTALDKVHKLEQLGIIPNAERWISMRQLRNHLAHEYPEHPQLTASYLNQTVASVPELIGILDNIIGKLKSSE